MVNFYGDFFFLFFNFLCRRDRSRTCLVCGHFSFDVASLHEMPSVSFHLNLETLKLFLSQSSCSQFFIEEDFLLLRLPPHVGRYKLSVRGKVMKLYVYFFFQFNILTRISAWWSFWFFLRYCFLLFFYSFLYCLKNKVFRCNYAPLQNRVVVVNDFESKALTSNV